MSKAMLVAHQIEKKWRSDDIKLGEDADFSSLCLAKPLLNGLKKAGFIRPSPIQLRAIPLGKVGLDLIVQAKSGTGKTCVFTVVALQSLCLNTKLAQVLIIVPTREIAYQICQVIRAIGVEYKDLSCQIFIGGLPLEQDKKKIENCQIAVGTPGRIKQLIEEKTFKPQSIRLLVLDEADILINSNIKDDVNWIYNHLPENKQIITCSATYTEDLIDWFQQYMRSPMCVRLDADKPALLGLVQYYQKIAHHPQQHLMQSSKQDLLIKLLSEISFSQCLIFFNFQAHAENAYDKLKSQNWPVAFICGHQAQLQRLSVINKLKKFQCRILISTDLTARGIDAEHVNLVINYEPPWDAETYLHRIGRAGRYGSYGISINLAFEGGELERLLIIQHQAQLDLYKLPAELNKIWEHVPQQEDLILLKENSQSDISSPPNSAASTENPVAKSTSEPLNSSNEHSFDSIANSSNQVATLNWAEMVDSNESSNCTKETEDSEQNSEETAAEDNSLKENVDKEVDLTFLKYDSQNPNDSLTYYEAKEDLEDFLTEVHVELTQTEEVDLPNLPYTREETREISIFLQQASQQFLKRLEDAKKSKHSEEKKDDVEKSGGEIPNSIEKTRQVTQEENSSNDVVINGIEEDTMTELDRQPSAGISYSREELYEFKDSPRAIINPSIFNPKFVELDMFRHTRANRKVLQDNQKKDMLREKLDRVKYPTRETNGVQSYAQKKEASRKNSDALKKPDKRSEQDVQKIEMGQEKSAESGSSCPEKPASLNKAIPTKEVDYVKEIPLSENCILQKNEILREDSAEPKFVLTEQSSSQNDELLEEKSLLLESPIPESGASPNPLKPEIPKQKLAGPEGPGAQTCQEDEITKENSSGLPEFQKAKAPKGKYIHPLFYLKPEVAPFQIAPPLLLDGPSAPPQLVRPSFSPRVSSSSRSPQSEVSQGEPEYEEPPKRGRNFKSRFSPSSHSRRGSHSISAAPQKSLAHPPSSHAYNTPFHWCHPSPMTASPLCHATPSHLRYHHPSRSMSTCCSSASLRPCSLLPCKASSHCSVPTPAHRPRPYLTGYCQVYQTYQQNFSRMKQWFKGTQQCCKSTCHC